MSLSTVCARLGSIMETKWSMSSWGTMDWSVSGGPLGRAGSGGCSSVVVRESRLEREECSDGEE